MNGITKYLLAILLYLNLSTSKYVTTFLIHGIYSKAIELIELENALINIGINTISLELKGDPKTSYNVNLDTQCEMYYNEILNIIYYHNNNFINISNKQINLIGISQGGLIARCIIEKYNNNQIIISNLITIATPNMGIYSNEYNLNIKLNITNLDTLITIQEYWKDPYNYIEYLNQHKFITLLNNEEYHTNYNKYKLNIMSLNTFTAIWSILDTVIKPKESCKFIFYNISIAQNLKKLELYNLTNTEWYNNDNLGLKYLTTHNKFESVMIPCFHNEFKLYKCFMHTKNNDNITLFDIIKNKLTH